MKKIILILLCLFAIFGINNKVNADSACTVDTVKQVAKIVYHEVGGDLAVNSDENFFMQMNTAAVLINVAMLKSGENLYQRMLNLTNKNYQGYSSYKDTPFEDDVPKDRQGEMLYIASLILNGKYTFPKNMIFQAACSCLFGRSAPECQGVDTGLPPCENDIRMGVVWTIVKTKSGFYDVYYGYDINDNSLASTDIFGNTISDTSVEHYKDLARRYENLGQNSGVFNTITPDNACAGGETVSDPGSSSTTPGGSGSGQGPGWSAENGNESGSGSKPETVYTVNVPTCENPEVLRVIFLARLIFNIIKIIIPIGLIVIGAIDFSKSVTTNNAEAQKKNTQLFIKRIIYALLVFFVPWIVGRIIVILGNLTKDEVNFTDCLENANQESIEAMQTKYDQLVAEEQARQNAQAASNSTTNPSSNTTNPGGNTTDPGNDEPSYTVDPGTTDNPQSNSSGIIFVGDSRTYQMCFTVASGGNTNNCSFSKNGNKPYIDGKYYYIAEGSKSYEWFNNTAVPAVNQILQSNSGRHTIVSLMGVNMLLYDIDKYVSKYRDLSNTNWSNHNIVLVSVMPIDESKASKNGYATKEINNANIEKFNNKLKGVTANNIKYCDLYSTMMSEGFDTSDGIHYTDSTYKKIYSMLQKCL